MCVKYSSPGVSNTRPTWQACAALFTIVKFNSWENFSREVNFVEMSDNFRGDKLLAGIAEKI